MSSPEARLVELGLDLPPVLPPAGTFVHAVRAGNMLYLGGAVPVRGDITAIQGHLGAELDVAAGYEAARVCALRALATVREELGTLNRVKRIVKLYGVVNATQDFMQHTQVMNGASDLLVQIFGEAGKHARLAVGVSSLPFNIACEIELTVEIAG